MINGLHLKVCGLTSVADAQAAAAAGAGYLGFIFHPKSPRYLSPEKYREMKAGLPLAKHVAVCVEPTPVDLARLGELGFDFFQIHFNADAPDHLVAAWAQTVGSNRLWLAPKLPAAQEVKPAWLDLAGTFLLDTFHPDKFGGTGATGDWDKFRRHQTAHPQKTWILSGGLTPENIAEAIRASGAKFVDVNSGVESAPGVKDPTKLRALAAALGR